MRNVKFLLTVSIRRDFDSRNKVTIRLALMSHPTGIWVKNELVKLSQEAD